MSAIKTKATEATSLKDMLLSDHRNVFVGGLLGAFFIVSLILFMQDKGTEVDIQRINQDSIELNNNVDEQRKALLGTNLR